MADKKTELGEIKRFGGTAQKNSGRGKFNKGDAIVGPFTADVKEYRTSYSVSRSNWSKICTDASKNGNEPALNIVLGEGQAVTRLWVIGEGMMLELLEAWEEKHGG